MKIKKKRLTIVFLMLIASLIIINSIKVSRGSGDIAKLEAMATNYSSITEFQNARWTEIQNNIFGEGVATSVTDSSLATKPIIEGNPYFTWMDTSVLGIKKWDGTIKKDDGTNYTDSDFYNEQGSLPQETITYTSTIADGVTDTRTVTYDVYNVNNANELRYVLSSNATTTNNKKIYLNSDIDLAGDKNILWSSINTSGGDLFIEGNGHTIYNFNSNTSGIFGTISNYMTILNLNMERVKIVTTKDAIAPIGQPKSAGIRFENVHVNGGFIQSSTNNAAGFIARPHSVNTFIKDCSSSNLYLYGKGQHTAGFSGCVCPVQGTFKGGYGVKYTVTYPEEPEALFGNSSTTLNSTNARYPFYITNCYSIDCEIFSTSGHSGGFVSCIDSGLVCKNSFSNNSIYGESSVGVFMGCQVNAGKMALYDDASAQSINAYFENCYTSGVVEGKSNIGGFMGADDDTSGATVYKNCYSTSMVGMDYSGTNVGGFIGVANNAATSTINGIGNKKGVMMLNCYAAGEVGNISTDTNIETAKTKKIGGFMGGYKNSSYLNLVNCYYDKQTTAMREVAVGLQGNGTNACELNGVTGVYTKTSEVKGVQGLTDIDMQDGSAWIYKDGYYPQLRAFTDNAVNNFSNSELIESYSTASAATVFLNHWDEIMTEDGNIQVQEDTAKIYDTIRDITSSFEFTSNANSNSPGYDLTWGIDSETNKVKGYVENLNITEEDGTIKTVPVLSIQNPVKSQAEGTSFGLDVSDIYKCYDFAPGKSWVKITVENTFGNNIVGTRKLRLLPTAYIDAGNYTEITLVTDNTEDAKVTQNKVLVEGKEEENTTYLHAEDTMYVITDTDNLGDNEVIYPGQVVSKNKNETNLFALWNRYPADLNSSSETTNKFDAMYDQALIGNSIDTGLAKVEVYSLGVAYREIETEENGVLTVPVINYAEEKRITGDALNDAKWRGEALFTTEDAGWYELKYYWRLNDGRYLTDSKIIVIKGNEVSAILNNNIIKGSTDYDNGDLKITPDIKQNTENLEDLTIEYTKTEEVKRGVETQVTEDGKVVKTIKIREFVDDELIAGWKNDDRYKLQELKVEVSKDGAAWATLPLDLENSSEAEYTYSNQNWQVKQYTDTKEYYIDPTGDPIEITLNAKLIKDVSTENDYVKFKFTTDNQETTDLVTNSNLRVTATFVPVEKITVTKNWLDESNIYALRPTSIFLKLIDTNGKEYVNEVLGNTTTDENWNSEFEVPSYDENGNKLTYTVDEEEDSGIYEKIIDNENSKITNKIIKYNISTKVEGVGGSISGESEEIYEQVVKSKSNEKLVIITPEEGYEIASIKINGVEQELPENKAESYTLNSFTNISEDKEIVVTFRENIVDVEVTKKWEDSNNENLKRPASILINLYADGVLAQSYKIDTLAENEQKYTFEDLPKYNALGNEIIYTLDEAEVLEGDLKFYEKQITGNVITNTFKVPDEKTNVEVTKIWNDSSNIKAKRPTSIKVELKNGNSVVNSAILTGVTDKWTYTFENLTKYDNAGNEIVYSVDEVEVSEGDLKFYSKEINGTVITNTFTVPDEKVKIEAKKVWVESVGNSKRPSSVKLVIKNAGEEILEKEVSESTEWKCEFEVPKYNEAGNEITYSIDEKEVNEGDLYFYEKSIDNTTYTVTNTFKVPSEKVSVIVTKVWDDNSNYANKRPSNILIDLYANGNIEKTQQISSDKNITEYTFENLAKYDEYGNEIVYTVDEREINEGELKFYSKNIDNFTNTITNTFVVPDEKTSVEVKKVWNDNNNENLKRPDSLRLVLKKGTEIIDTYVITDTSENEQSYTFENLPKYDDKGNVINYLVDEREINEGDLEFYTKKISGSVITNTFTVPEDKVSFTATKEWYDNDDYAKKRPSSVIVQVLSGENVLQESTLNSENNWKCTFKDLPKYDEEGNEIDYQIKEKESTLGELYFYETEIDNGNIKLKNTFRVPDVKVSKTVTKIWEDESNKAGKRPSSIIIDLYADDVLKESYEITDTSENEQSYTFENLPKYDELGNEIIYKVDEREKNTDDLKFYTKNVNGDIITNTFTVPDEKINVVTTKIWEDNSNEGNKRPSSITIMLYENGVYKESGTIKNTLIGNEQTHTFTVPRYDEQGNEIVYTVDEAEVAVGDLKFYTKNVTGTTITNTFAVPNEKIDISVSKVWEDNLNEKKKRPDSIKIILNDKTGKVAEKVLNKESVDIQTYTFEDLPKYDTLGNEVIYTVDEEEINENDLKFYKKSVSGTVITNTFTVPDEKINVEVKKVWVDNSTIRRPESLKLELLRNGIKIQEKIVETDLEAEKIYVFENLIRYDENGDEYTYTVDEKEVNDGDLYFYTKSIDDSTNTITNTFVVQDDKINITATKKWDDNDNKARKRPTSVILQIKNGETIVQSKMVDTSSNWTNEFVDLPKYDEIGNEIVYTLDEAETNVGDLKFYTKKVESNVIINTFTVPDETTSVTITKTWEDSSNAKLKRPASILIEIKNGSNIVKTEELTGTEDTWTATIDNLPKYDENGDVIRYTIDEKAKNTGELSAYTKQVKGYSIINTLKQYNITTSVDGEGGEISGASESIYEQVTYGNSNTKDIIITPSSGYKISSIKVNDKEIEFTANLDGTYTLETFENVTENKNIVVSFEKKDAKVIVKYIDEEGNSIVEDEVIDGKVGDSYNTSAKEFDEYILKLDPENANGEMTEEEITVNYIYSKVKGKVTITKVDSKDNTKLLEGATFKIEKLTDNGSIDNTYTFIEKTTDSTGKVEFTDLEIGKYKITETKAPEGYNLSEDELEVQISKDDYDIEIMASDKMKLILPETGKVNYTLLMFITGMSIIIVSKVLNRHKNDMKLSKK